MKQNGVSDDALRLSLFPYSLTHHAIAWYDRLPRNSIHSFDDMMKEYSHRICSSLMVYKNKERAHENSKQKPHESLFEAWERYKLSIDRVQREELYAKDTGRSYELIRHDRSPQPLTLHNSSKKYQDISSTTTT
ncbi:reverse transcriptase domain-containing protein [Tanacetum coccineum]